MGGTIPVVDDKQRNFSKRRDYFLWKAREKKKKKVFFFCMIKCWRKLISLDPILFDPCRAWGWTLDRGLAGVAIVCCSWWLRVYHDDDDDDDDIQWARTPGIKWLPLPLLCLGTALKSSGGAGCCDTIMPLFHAVRTEGWVNIILHFKLHVCISWPGCLTKLRKAKLGLALSLSIRLLRTYVVKCFDCPIPTKTSRCLSSFILPFMKPKGYVLV